MDEFHLLLKEEQTAAYSVEIWKRFRKWGGIPTGITQNVKDLLASREVENIFENSDFVYLLNQASGDRQILSKALNISPSQQNYITNSNAGEGLIFYGSTIVPFKDDFPKDTQLYRIEQMCEILSISTKTGYRILREGKICCLKVGRAYRIPKAHLFTFLCIGCGEAVTA